MPNNKSAEKRVRINSKKMMENKMVKSRLKTAVKKFDSDCASSDKAAAQASMVAAAKLVDKAAARNLIHKNNAANKKSRMALKLNAVQ